MSRLASDLCIAEKELRVILTGQEPQVAWLSTALVKLRHKGYPELVLMELDGRTYPHIAGRLEGEAQIIHRTLGPKGSGRSATGGD